MDEKYLSLIEDKKNAYEKLKEAKEELGKKKRKLEEYAEERTGFKIHQSVTVLVSEENEDTEWGYITGFDCSEDGTIRLKVRFQFGSGKYLPSEILHSGDIVTLPEDMELEDL